MTKKIQNPKEYTKCRKCNGIVETSDTICSWCGNDLTLLPQQEIGYVYLLKAGEFYKIGKSKQYEKRIAEIKLQLPFEVTEVHKIKTNNIDALELHWHRYFRKMRRNGEWFELSTKDIEEFTSIKEINYH